MYGELNGKSIFQAASGSKIVRHLTPKKQPTCDLRKVKTGAKGAV
jgi:hypothetical protein